MARRPRVFAAGLLYHVIVRGNQRRKTFRHDDDYRAYLDRLEKYRTHCQVWECGYGVSEVTKYLGRDQANVSTMLSRLSARQTERKW
jgi:REP element-mobilizing transposase RayT